MTAVESGHTRLAEGPVAGRRCRPRAPRRSVPTEVHDVSCPRRVTMVTLHVNGKAQQADVTPDTPLLWALRDVLGLTGTKFGCGMALCGACTVHVDGQPTRACITPVSAVGQRKVTTIEAIGADRVGKAVQAAWIGL